jgi:hypothetical protein
MVSATATMVACNKEGDGNSSKSNDNKGDWQATAMRAMGTSKATTWVMAMATRLAGDEEGRGKGGKGNRGQWQWG